MRACAPYCTAHPKSLRRNRTPVLRRCTTWMTSRGPRRSSAPPRASARPAKPLLRQSQVMTWQRELLPCQMRILTWQSRRASATSRCRPPMPRTCCSPKNDCGHADLFCTRHGFSLEDALYGSISIFHCWKTAIKGFDRSIITRCLLPEQAVSEGSLTTWCPTAAYSGVGHDDYHRWLTRILPVMFPLS